MEPLAEVLGITVSELLGIDGQPTETVIRNITEISEKEKSIPKRLLQNFFAVILTVMILMLAVIFICFSITNDRLLRSLFLFSGGAGIFNIFALFLGIASFVMGIMSVFSPKETSRWKTYSLVSLMFCTAGLHIPILVTYLIMRFEHISTADDVIGAYYFGSAVLFVGSIAFNLCSVIVHRAKNNF